MRRPLVVIASWVLLAGVLALLFPPLPAQTAKHAQKPFPDDAPTMITAKAMAKAFDSPGQEEEAGGGGGGGGAAGSQQQQQEEEGPPSL